MKPSKIRTVLTRRLGYLEAQLASGLPERHAAWYREEADALRSVLARLGLLDEPAVESSRSACVAQVLPRMDARRARERSNRDRVRELVTGVEVLVGEAQRVGRVA